MKGSDKGKPMVAAPGELYSTAQGAPVASTELIYDYLKEKSQETINTEVLLKLNELEANQGGNDGLSEQQVLNKIDASLQSLNTENSGTLGSTVAALANAVGNNTSTKSHEERITELEMLGNSNTYTKDVIDLKIEGVRGSIETLGNGVSTSITNINGQIDTINTEIEYLTGTVTNQGTNLSGEIATLSDNTNASLADLKKRIPVEFYGPLDATGLSISPNYNNSTSSRIYYLSDRKTFVSGLSGATLLYKDWPNRYLYTEEPGGSPYSSKVYICKGICYAWDKDAQELKTIEGAIDPGTSPATPRENQTSLDDLDNVRDTSKGTKYDVIL